VWWVFETLNMPFFSLFFGDFEFLLLSCETHRIIKKREERVVVVVLV